MDEPTDGLDPNQKHHVRELIRQMAKDKAIIISTHILEEVDAVCTRAVIIDKGRIVADGTADALESRARPITTPSRFRVAGSAADKAKAALEGLPSVAKVEITGRPNGAVALRAIPKAGSHDRQATSRRCCASNGIDVQELYIEKGRLDDVFRQITSDDRKSKARANA